MILHFNSKSHSFSTIDHDLNSGTGFFLWILWNVSEHLLSRTLPGDCLYDCLYLLPKTYSHLHIRFPYVCVKPWSRSCISKRHWRPLFQSYENKQKICRSSRSQMFFKIDILKTFVIFTGKRLCWSLFLMMLQAFRS